MALPLIKPGKRALIAGRTGSGKSTLARWLLTRSPGFWVILNPKHTKAYNALPESVALKSMELSLISKQFNHYRYLIINPESSDANVDDMDAFIMMLHQAYENVGLICDELYTLHKNGVAGQGLLSWLTRGRELHQSFLGLTQRPAWLSQFLFSESDYICSMSLSLAKDRKRMIEMTGSNAMGEKVQPRIWTWFDVARDSAVRYGPVPIA